MIKKIFVADDSVFYLHYIEKALKNLGFNELTLFQQEEDLLKAIPDKPDVIFLDNYMQSLTGAEILKKIKEINPDIFVVIISGQEESKNTAETIRLGAFDYIEKSKSLEERIAITLDKINTVKNISV